MKFNATKILAFTRLLSVEPLGFLTLFLFLFKKLAIDQMLQDKLCLQRYNLPPPYCHALPTLTESDDYFSMKSSILGDVTAFQMYINICLAIPTVALALLLGPFIDKYGPAKRALFVYSAVVFLLESVTYLAWAFWFTVDYRLIVFSSIVGAASAGPMIGLTCSWSYLSSVTPSHLRSYRLMIMEVAISTAPPLAIALGGNLLDLSPLFPSREPRNYCAIFLLSILGSLVYLGLSLFLVTEEKDRTLFEEHFPREAHHRESYRAPHNPIIIQNSDLTTQNQIHSTESLNKRPEKPLEILFNLENVKEMIATFTKDRPYQIRTQIVLLFAAKIICQFANYGPAIFLYQYVQKVFSWNASQYSNYVSGSNLINILSTFLLAPVLIKIFKMADLHYALLGASLMLAQNFLRLLSISVWTFYAALPFYAVNSLSTVGISAYITKVTERSEVGRIFSLMGVLDSLVPLISSIVFASLFRLTIDSKPNLSFLAVVFGLVAGVGLLGFVAWKGKGKLEKIEESKVTIGGIEDELEEN